MKKIITDAAVHFLNCPDTERPVKGKIKVSNIHSGIVVFALRHKLCLDYLKAAGFAPSRENIIDGFIAQDENGDNTFVDRTLGGKIAFQSGQIEKQLPLFSEAIFPPKEGDLLGYNLKKLTG